MTDIFREVEEDVRRERVEKFWKAYGNYVIAAVVLVFAGIGGWQLWERHDLQERQKLSDQLMAAQRITNPRDAASAFVDLSRNAPKGYANVARLSEANAMFASGQRAEAIDLYKDIANGDSGPIGSVARLRAAWAMADSSTRGQVTDWLAPLTQPGNAWRENAREVLAYAAYRGMDLKGAATQYAELAADPDAPDGVRARAKAMAAFLKTGGATSFGSVPPDAAPAAPGAPPAPAP